MIKEKHRASLERKPGRTSTHGSDPLDHDPAAEDVTVRVLILAARNRSDGSGAMGARGGAGSLEIQVPRRRFTGNSSEFAFLVLRGLNQLAFGSRGFYASRVIHQRIEPGLGRPWDAVATAGADLRGGARRRGCVRAVLGLDPSARGSVSVCSVNANPNKGCTGLWCSAVGPPWRIHGVHSGETPACVVCATRAAYAPS